MLPVGVEDFEKLIKENYYYVDKTGLIIDLLKNRGEANLFTRPRRFGKSLNMKMLEAFFSPVTDKSVFDGLKVSGEKELCDTYMGKIPVISLSLSGIEASDYNEAYRSVVLIINGTALKVYDVVKNSEKVLSEEKQILTALIKEDVSESLLSRSVCIMSRVLEKHYGHKVIVLIDEYDVPLAKAHERGYYDSMVLLIKKLLGQTLKGNDSLFFAVLTGCLRITKESIFTGLNNLKVLSISDTRFDEYFGFTDLEVRDILEYYGLSEKYDAVKEWYDGYRIGKKNIYCPWDVVNYCDDLIADPELPPKNYWLNTSGNSVVRRFIEQTTNTTIKREIERLINGEYVEKTIREDLTYQDMYSSTDNIWSLLYMTGYLTQQGKSDGNLLRLVIPNREIRSIFALQIMEFFKESVSKDGVSLGKFCDALQKGDAAGAENSFNIYLRRTISLRDTFVRKSTKENFYHGILIGILGLKEDWDVSSNAELGDGYADIFVSIGDYETAILIEIKYAEDGDLEGACRRAAEQIKQKRYADELDEYSHVLKYAIACCRKRCMVMLCV